MSAAWTRGARGQGAGPCPASSPQLLKASGLWLSLLPPFRPLHHATCHPSSLQGACLLPAVQERPARLLEGGVARGELARRGAPLPGGHRAVKRAQRLRPQACPDCPSQPSPWPGPVPDQMLFSVQRHLNAANTNKSSGKRALLRKIASKTRQWYATAKSKRETPHPQWMASVCTEGCWSFRVCVEQQRGALEGLLSLGPPAGLSLLDAHNGARHPSRGRVQGAHRHKRAQAVVHLCGCGQGGRAPAPQAVQACCVCCMVALARHAGWKRTQPPRQRRLAAAHLPHRHLPRLRVVRFVLAQRPCAAAARQLRGSCSQRRLRVVVPDGRVEDASGSSQIAPAGMGRERGGAARMEHQPAGECWLKAVMTAINMWLQPAFPGNRKWSSSSSQALTPPAKPPPLQAPSTAGCCQKPRVAAEAACAACGCSHLTHRYSSVAGTSGFPRTTAPSAE